jgi:uncharacterized DUF497 family protein
MRSQLRVDKWQHSSLLADVKFEWDAAKEAANIAKHGVNFSEAQLAFSDPGRVILTDKAHRKEEPRFFCIGWSGRGVLTVRFTYRRGGTIRIIGAAYWRKGRKIYEEQES